MFFGLFHQLINWFWPEQKPEWKATKTADKCKNVYVIAKWSELQMLKHL